MAGVLVYSLVIAISCLGALNANLIATSALCVAASKRHYLPSVFANVPSPRSEGDTRRNRQSSHKPPSHVLRWFSWFVRLFQNLSASRSVPVLVCNSSSIENLADTGLVRYPMLLNCVLACFYLIIGTFNDLITFIGKLRFCRLLGRNKAMATNLSS